MSDDQSTPAQSTPVNDAITGAAQQQELRLAAATQARTAQRSTRRIVTTPAKAATTAKPRTIVRGPKAPKRTTAPATTKPAPVSLSQKEAKELAAKSTKVQQERIVKARQVLAQGDLAQWEVAKLTFEATEADNFAKMSKQDWADALGVSPSHVSRWAAVHEKYGVSTARQFVGTGAKRKEMSFNDHIELLKESDPKEQEKLFKVMQAEGVSFATALKRRRDADKNGQASGKSKDKTVDAVASLVNRANADDEDRSEALQELGKLAVKHLIAFGQAFDSFALADLTEQDKQVVRSILSQATEIEQAFEAKIDAEA